MNTLDARHGSKAHDSRSVEEATTSAPQEPTILDELAAANQALYRSWRPVDQLRVGYQSRHHEQVLRLLDEWIYAACVSDPDPLVRSALIQDLHRAYIANAITLSLSNAHLEGMNSTVRLISHRARGFCRLDSLLATLTLICGRIPVKLLT